MGDESGSRVGGKERGLQLASVDPVLIHIAQPTPLVFKNLAHMVSLVLGQLGCLVSYTRHEQPWRLTGTQNEGS